MFAYYWPIGLLVLSNVFYHITAKSIPSDVDAFFRWWMEDPGIPGQYELSFHEDTNEIYYDYL